MVFRRNHAYFWYPVKAEAYAPVGLLIDDPEATVILEQNSIEGPQGTPDPAIIQEKRGSGEPEAAQKTEK